MEWDALVDLWPLAAVFLLALRKRQDKKKSGTSRPRKVPLRPREEGQTFRRDYEPIEPK